MNNAQKAFQLLKGKTMTFEKRIRGANIIYTVTLRWNKRYHELQCLEGGEWKLWTLACDSEQVLAAVADFMKPCLVEEV